MVKMIFEKKLQLIVIVAATVLVYANIFQNQFVIDDSVFIEQWEGIRSFDFINFFKGNVPDGHEGVYRPIRSVLYALYYSLFGTNPFGWHLHSLLIHLISTILIFFIVSSLARAPIPFTSALLFGLHPVHTEAITYIASSMDMTGVVFFLLSFYLYLKGKKMLSLVLAALAYFTSEITLVLPALIVLHEICFRRKLKVYKLWPYFVLALVYTFVRFFVLGITTRGPYLANSFYLTMLTMSKVFVKYLLLLFFPFNLANNHVISKGIEAFVYRDYRTEAIVSQSLFDPQILFSIFILCGLIFVVTYYIRNLPLVSFCILWFIIALLPVSGLIPQGSILNERMLYIPSFGFCLLLAWIILKLNKFYLTVLLTILFITSYGYLTYLRNQDWQNEISLWRGDIKVYPDENAYAYYQLGNAYAKKNMSDKAIEVYLNSNKINPKFVLGLGQIGLILTRGGQEEEAIKFYQSAISQNPTFWEGRFNLGNIYLQKGMLELALVEYQEVLKINPDFLPAKVSLEKVREQYAK